MTNCMKTAVAGALLALSAGAMAQSSPMINSDDRGVRTPQSAPEQPIVPPRMPGGQPTISTSNTPMSPNESKPSIPRPEPFVAAPRGDNPNLPNPVTPSAANESAAQPKLKEPTNMTGMEGRGAVGGTRSDMQRRTIESSVPAPVGDSRNMPNPRTPSSVNESAPDKALGAGGTR